MRNVIAVTLLFIFSSGAYAAVSREQLGLASQPGGSGSEFYRSVSLEGNSAEPVMPEPSFAVPGCYAPANGGAVNTGTMDACIRGSKMILDNAPAISSPEDILKGGLKGAGGFQMSETVSCEFVPMTSEEWSTTGYSEKFRCYHINSDTSKPGKYFNSKGVLVPEAVSVGANGTSVAGLLLDAGGRAVMNPKGKPHKAERLKVKYYTGKPRMREPFTETAGTRLFWALGIPADNVFFPKQIICHGCLANPYEAKQAAPASGSQTFQWASIEKNFDGVAIANKSDKGWEWEALRAGAGGSGQMPQFDTLFLASRLIALSHPKPLQNKTRCGNVDGQTGQCSQVYSYVADLGSSFGKPTMLESPRGDLTGYRKQNVFADKKTCSLGDSYLGHIVSEAGRGLMAQRLLRAFGGSSSGSIDSRRVRAIFQAAHFEGIDLDPADSGELDAWTEKLVSLMQEVLNTHCPAKPVQPTTQNDSGPSVSPGQYY
jgi:hypothetical protein